MNSPNELQVLDCILRSIASWTSYGDLCWTCLLGMACFQRIMPGLELLFLPHLIRHTLYGAWLLCDLMPGYDDESLLKAGCCSMLRARVDPKMKGICLAI